jgi:glycosyltransferase involved in cell wall biosynthesis
MSDLPHVTLVLPCYNEGSRVCATLATLEAWFGPAVDVLIVDDGSADDTAMQAERYAQGRPHVRVHRVGRNRGKGGALRSAMPVVRGDLVVFMDADLAFERSSVQRAIDHLADADMVVGNRRHDHSYYTVPVRLFGFLYRRHLVGFVFNRFVRLCVPVAQRDTQCGLKAFRRTSLQAMAPSLTSEGFALDVEMLVVAQALGLRLAEIPVDVRYESARSSVALAGSAWAMASDVVRIALRRAFGAYSPGRVRARAASAGAARADAAR